MYIVNYQLKPPNVFEYRHTHKSNNHSRASGVATTDYANTSYLLFLALRVVTWVVMTEMGQNAVDPEQGL